MTVHGPRRSDCIERLRAALSQTVLLGLPATNLAFLTEVLDYDSFRGGAYDTGLVSKMKASHPGTRKDLPKASACIATLLWRWILNRESRKSFRQISSSFRNVPHRNQCFTVELSHGVGEHLNGAKLNVSYTVGRSWKDPSEGGPVVSLGSGHGGSRLRDSIVNTTFEVAIFESGDTNKPAEQTEATPLYSDQVTITDLKLDADGTNGGFSGGEIRALVGGIQQTFSIATSSSKTDAYQHVIHIQSSGWSLSPLTAAVLNELQSQSGKSSDQDRQHITPMPCRILAINAPSGTKVKPGDAILTVESMKMETKIRAKAEGVVKITVNVNDVLKAGVIIAVVE
ncbi:hypothetical protein HDV05_007219 [Chytridiales sp. JEL 0842]|nr:hypothetical protein HDV05_007219 [Chytridiales sp. JEL 0842]